MIISHILDTASAAPPQMFLSLSPLGDRQLSLKSQTPPKKRYSMLMVRLHRHLLPPTHTLSAGIYRVQFETATYFQTKSTEGPMPYVDIVFTVSDKSSTTTFLAPDANGYTIHREVNR